MKILSRSLWSFLALFLICAGAVAQVDEKEKAKKEAELKRELQRKSYVLVDEIATGALSLKLPENRSFVLAEAADLLWERDEKRARNLFWDANNTLTLMTDSAQNNADDKKKARNSFFFVTFGLRRELLRKVSTRDPQLAIDLLRSSPPAPQEVVGANYLPDLEQEIAAEAATRDPKRALQIARESLAKGLTFSIFNLLLRLHGRDTELSSQFAGELIEKLQTRNLATDIVASRIATELLITSRVSKETADDETYLVEHRPLKLSREQRRQVVVMIANAAVELSANSSLLYTITELMPEIEEFAPERVALLNKKVAAFNETLNKEQKGWNLHNSLVRNGTPEEMLAAAQGIDSDQRRFTQQQAIVLAVMRKRADSLREYINTEIKDDGARKGLIEMLDAEQINTAINKRDSDELRRLLSLVRLKEEKARAMAEMAMLLEQKGNHEEALKLLDEAQTLIKGDFSSDTQSNALLALVSAYALVEPLRGFAIIEAAIDRANEQISRLLLLDKLVRTGSVKKGEILLQHSAGVSLDFVMFRYGKSMSALARADFDRTKAAADRLTRNELRLMARLMLAQTLLSEDKLKRMTGQH